MKTTIRACRGASQRNRCKERYPNGPTIFMAGKIGQCIETKSTKRFFSVMIWVWIFGDFCTPPWAKILVKNNIYWNKLSYTGWPLTIQLVQNLPLTLKQKFRLGLAWPTQNFCFDVNGRLCSLHKLNGHSVSLYRPIIFFLQGSFLSGMETSYIIRLRAKQSMAAGAPWA